MNTCSKCHGPLDDGGSCESPKFNDCDRASLVRMCEGTRAVKSPTRTRPHRYTTVPCKNSATAGILDPKSGKTYYFCDDCTESFRDHLAELAGEAAGS